MKNGPLAFLVPLSLQALLLHPVFPSTLSRLVRLLLTPFSLALSFATPYRYAIEPRNQAIGVNFVIGIMGAYGIMKGLEWGLAADLLPYTFVGFDPATGTTANAQDKAATTRDDRLEARRRRRAHLAALRAKRAAEDGPIDILRATAHLLVSMRGQGYEFCGTTTAPFALDHAAFFSRVVKEVAWAHPLLVLCSAALLEPPTSRDAALFAVLPSALVGDRAPQERVHAVGEALTGLAMGTAVFAALTLGFSVATLGAFLGTLVVRRIPFVPEALCPPPWDAREYPPLFNLAERPQSVAKFWSHQWHSFFSRPFRFLAFKPTQRVVAPVLGKSAARAAGVLAVFALSAWLHEFGLASAISTLPRPSSPLSFLTKWGGSVYFLSQGVGVVLEGAFTAATGRRVRGWAGTVWTAAFVACAGGWLYSAWVTQGLVREVPPVRYWAWQRYVVPMACLQPPPVWMNAYPTSYGLERAA
ncbi:uncharacterized protein RHOBADRAFT_53614 [Rhodotorula graminis WP1]|uniref:Wax synthase domain-containing protein n=1 Tax=Rhodotorula graminis (strain WP1) TaxID=578459 RepID=A0A194S1P7_RHOGW|nr:uncharacterized protein RHOBADRAFT_53614 [Rhodotorula graminis WP1]KPV74653.1 hypothetical protein RHOBADRAFT_53614 [Rhodotorula graminis WP1]